MHLLEEWRIRDVEQKAERATSRLYEIDALRSELGSVERTCRELRAEVDGLRNELEATKDQQAQHLILIEQLLELAKESNHATD